MHPNQSGDDGVSVEIDHLRAGRNLDGACWTDGIDALATQNDRLVVTSSSTRTIDATTVRIVSGPTHGSVAVIAQTGAVTYTPAANYNGPDNFSYTVRDNEGAESCPATGRKLR